MKSEQSVLGSIVYACVCVFAGIEGMGLFPNKAHGSVAPPVRWIFTSETKRQILATERRSEYLFCSYLMRWKSSFEILCIVKMCESK